MKTLLSLAAAALTTTALFGAAVADAQTSPAAPREARAAAMTRADAHARAKAAFERLDTNQDSILDAADRDAAARQRFASLDTDADGALSFEEFSAAQPIMRRVIRQQAGASQIGEQRGGEPAGGEPRAGRGRAGAIARPDGVPATGQISEADFVARALARFDALDADGNGVVTAEERRAAGRRGTAGAEPARGSQE